MTDAILVLNAGSSRLKFSLFHDHTGDVPQLALHGQIEAILATPHSNARDADGATLADDELGAAARACAPWPPAASWLGVDLDERANAGGGPRISKDGGAVSAWVPPTNEELMIAARARGDGAFAIICDGANRHGGRPLHGGIAAQAPKSTRQGR